MMCGKRVLRVLVFAALMVMTASAQQYFCTAEVSAGLTPSGTSYKEVAFPTSAKHIFYPREGSYYVKDFDSGETYLKCGDFFQDTDGSFSNLTCLQSYSENSGEAFTTPFFNVSFQFNKDGLRFIRTVFNGRAFLEGDAPLSDMSIEVGSCWEF